MNWPSKLVRMHHPHTESQHQRWALQWNKMYTLASIKSAHKGKAPEWRTKCWDPYSTNPNDIKRYWFPCTIQAIAISSIGCLLFDIESSSGANFEKSWSVFAKEVFLVMGMFMLDFLDVVTLIMFLFLQIKNKFDSSGHLLPWHPDTKFSPEMLVSEKYSSVNHTFTNDKINALLLADINMCNVASLIIFALMNLFGCSKQIPRGPC